MRDFVNATDRCHALLQVNKAALTFTRCADVFDGFCTATKKVLQFNRAGLMVYDPEHDNLRVAGICGNLPNSFFRLGAELNRHATPHGVALQQQRFVIRTDIRREAEFEIEQLTLAEGLHSYCAVPLILRGSSIGVVTILSYRKQAYSEQHARFLQDLANQITLAVDSFAPCCATHPRSKLMCPRCIASAGGLRTAAKHKEQLSAWGRQGGRSKRRTIN
ncbi:MAG TPA: GAF domain-containing protein [Terriglobales bacterium]|nr:GAF domain-containing protein [Terriglobales bacterium]